jgi:hypothetical protein
MMVDPTSRRHSSTHTLTLLFGNLFLHNLDNVFYFSYFFNQMILMYYYVLYSCHISCKMIILLFIANRIVPCWQIL